MSEEENLPNLSEKEYISLLLFRAQIYSILRNIFLFEPSREYLNNLLQDRFLNKIIEVYPEKCLRDSASDFLEAVMEILRGGENALIDTWAEYTRLFIGPGPPATPPYESLWIDEHEARRYKGEAWLKVRDWLLDEGLILESQTILEDHAGIEFEYMMVSTIKAVEMLEKNDRTGFINILIKQKKFLEEHLITWIIKLCDAIEQKSHSSFYKSFARFTKYFIKEDEDLLKQILNNL